jgi:APA family basic amino acid/polyamine antiporter
MIGGFILTPRLLYALAERGQLPAVLARVHPRTRTPHVAILASAAVVLVLTVFNSFLSALVLATAVRLVTYIACCGALLRLRRRGEPPAAFTAPWGRVLAVVGAGIAAVVLVVSALEQLVWTAAAAVAGLALLYLARRRSA